MPISLTLSISPTSVQPNDNVLGIIGGKADSKGVRGTARVYNVAPDLSSTLILEKKNWRLQTTSFNFVAGSAEGDHTIRLDFILGSVTTSVSQILTVAGSAPPPPAASPKTDYGTYAEPALPALPAAGGKFTDPTFGTTIMRVTDAGDGTHLSTVYSYWPSFNYNATRLMVVDLDNSGLPYFYAFNPTTFTLGAKTVGPLLGFNNGSYWHPTNPDIIYTLGRVDTLLYQYNVATNTTTVIKDFASVVGPGKFISQPSMSTDCTVIGFNIKNSSDYTDYGYAAYNLTTNALLLLVADSTIDEVHMNKSGTHMIAMISPPFAARLWNFSDTSTNQYLPFYDPASPLEGMSHSTMETNVAVAFTATFTGTVSKWLLSNLARTELLNLGFTNTGVQYISCLADNENWVLVSLSDAYPHVVLPFHNELFLVKTDGSGSVYRFCHHRVVFFDYFDGQFANISRDGKWVAFTSNWGATSANSRRDVFIVNIPNSPAV